MPKTIQECRIDSVLDTRVNYGGRLGVLTRRSWLQHWKEQGAKVEIEQVPSVKYNRVKYNRMDWEEQADYDKKLAKLKNEYRLYSNPSTFWAVTRVEYDYFVGLCTD